MLQITPVRIVRGPVVELANIISKGQWNVQLGHNQEMDGSWLVLGTVGRLRANRASMDLSTKPGETRCATCYGVSWPSASGISPINMTLARQGTPSISRSRWEPRLGLWGS